MAGFGTEVGDAYIQVHADTDAFRRELRGKLAGELRRFAKKANRTFSQDLNFDKASHLDAFRKNLAKASTTGDWGAIKKQFGGLGDWAGLAKKEIERLAKTMVELRDLEGNPIGEEPFFTKKQFDDVMRSLKEYETAMDSEKSVQFITRRNQEWSRQISLMKELTPEVKEWGAELVEMNKKATEAERARMGENTQNWDKYVNSIRTALSAVTRLEQREHAKREQGYSKFYQDLAQQYDKDYQTYTRTEKAKFDEQQRLARIDFRARQLMAAQDERKRVQAATREQQEIKRRKGLYTRMFDGLRHSRNDFVHGLAVILDTISTVVGKAFEGIAKTIQYFGDTLGPGGGGFKKIFDDMITNVKGFGEAIKTGWPGLVAIVAALAASFAFVALAAGTLVSLLSGLGAIVVGLASSLGMAIMAIVPLAGAAVGMGYGIGLAVAAFKDMKKYLPGAIGGLEELKRVFNEVDVKAFAAGIEGPLNNLFRTLAESLEFDTVAQSLGGAFGGVIDSLTEVVNSAGWKSFMTALQTTIPKGIEGLGAGFGGVLSGLFSAFGAGGPAVEKMGGAFASFGAEFAKTMDEADKSGKLTDFFNLAADSLIVIADLGWSVGEALVGLFEAAGPAGNEMLKSITGLVDEFTTWVTSAEGKNQIAEWMEFGKEVGSKLWDILKEIGVQFKRLDTPENRQFALNLLDAIKSIITGVGNVIVFFTDMNEKAVNAWIAIRTGADEATAAVGGFFAGVKKLLGDVGQSITDWGADMDAAIERFRAGVGEKFSAVGDSFGRVWQEITDWWATVDWGSLAGDIWQGFKDGMSEAWATFKESFGALFQPFIDSVKELFGIASPSTVFAGIGKDIIQGLWNGIKEKWEALKTWFTTTLTDLGTKIKDKWEDVKKTATEKWEAIKTAIQSKVDAARTMLVSKWNEIKTAVSSKVEEIRNLLSTKWEAIKTKVSDTWTSVRNTVTTKWNEIKSAVSAKIGEVVAVVGSLPGKAVDALTGIGTKLYQSGKSLVEGFISGITIAGRNIWNAAWGVAQKAIAGARAALQEGSPSKVFREIGFNVGRGMELGILDSTPKVKAAMARLTSVPTGADALGMGMGLGGGRAYVSNNSRVVNVAPGAIQVSSRATNPRLVAGMILDDMAIRVGG